MSALSPRITSSGRFSIVGTFLVVFVLVAGLIWVGVTLVGRSFVPEGTGRDEIQGLSSEASITRDQQGIPYIVATTELDAYTALGYAHAQDRLWQMDMVRRAGEGRLSEVFGRRTIAFDALLRTIGFRRICEQILRTMPGPTRTALEAYSRGVNAFLASHSGRLPMEFDALAYEPEPWTPLHSVLVSRLLAWELNTSFWSDVVYGAIRERVDSLKLLEILPSYPTDAPTIIPGGQRPEAPVDEPVRRADTSRPLPVVADSVRPASAGLPLDVLRLERSMREFVGINGSHVGSNVWAVAPSKAAAGRAMLANDPHLMHTAPGRWYQVMMLVGDDHRAGVTIPGAPFVVIGRNDHIAWGMASMMADETDFYIERLDSATGTRAQHDGSWEPLRILRDTITVKDSASVPFIIRISRHGPIISDVHPFASGYPIRDTLGIPRDTASFMMREAVAMRWRGADVTQDLAAFHRINRARSLDEFTAATRLGGVPSLSFVYADARGRIAYVPSARVPVRGDAGSPNLPMPGWDSRYNWKGSIPMERLPRLVDPERGWIACANNKVSNGLAFTLGDQWEDPSRSIRLEELLSEGTRFEIVDFVQMQGDVRSPQMRTMVGHLLAAFADSGRQRPLIRDVIGRLRRWDGSMEADGIESAIVAVWFQTLVEKTYRDELGSSLFAHYVQLAQSPIKALRRHARIDSRWFDDVRTPARENRDAIMRASLGDALSWLQKRFSANIATWRYGSFHTLSMPHVFASDERMRSIVNVGPIELGGSNTTLNNTEWDFNRPYNVRLGASMRQIVDFADTAVYLRSIVTTGTSGQPLSQFYSNQTILWSALGHVSLLRTVPSGKAVSSRTELLPAGS